MRAWLPRAGWWAFLVGLVAAGVAGWAADPQSKAGQRPNIVLILADDLGARDLGCDGADLNESPRLDRFAKEGVRFLRAYAPAPVCTPSRASLLTGKHPARLGMTTWSESALKPPRDREFLEAVSLADLPRSEVTLATRLREAGYLTAVVGKWHLGDTAHGPEAHGFDVAIGGTHWGAPATYFFPYRGSGRFGSETRFVPHLEFGKEGEYLTDRLTREALRVIEHAAGNGRPFFLLLAHHAPHTPIEAKPADVAYFQGRVKDGMRQRNPVYAAMIRSLDDGVGQVLDRLEQLKLAGNTVVIFTSDNGGYIGMDARQQIPVTTNAPLRSGKGSLWEGGIRVPLLVRWPGVTPVGGECGERVVLTDLFPTLLHAAGLTGDAVDGRDLTGLLRDPRSQLGREALYFHYPHHYHAPRTTPVGAILSDGWKLVQDFAEGSSELYHLDSDPGEARDLAREQAERVRLLGARLETWRQEVGARMPTRNPDAPGR